MTAVLAGSPTAAPGWDAAWSDALAELELSVDEAEALIRAGHTQPLRLLGAWQPPSGLGMLPAPLVDRARALLARQVRVAQQLAEAAAHSRRQLRAVEGMRADAESTPVYLDTAG
ncbi:hypothetical protein [uncultured Cellulomonas sp.]|uniref:hypothetical protein n=1 Tax=uncultured Cellulomonas sp. TaxID=189682 RepID=UPI00261A77CF|nr:hypothetical protein [uncultured Cellulomonas sp.]